MLESLHVKNLALIDETEVNFTKGLNILTGETGAGKSILIGSIHLALGGKSNKDIIRSGAEYALVELVFSLENEEQKNRIMEMELPIEEDGTIILQRKITPQRSVCKVGGEMISQKQLQDLADLLIDIHGQHDNRFLLNPKKHLEILDSYCGTSLTESLSGQKKLYAEYLKIKRELMEEQMDDAQRNREVSLLEYELKEIEEADLKDGEDEELETTYRRMLHSQKLVGALNRTLQLTAADESASAGSLIGHALRELHTIYGIEDRAEQLGVMLTDIENLLSDFNHEVQDYLSDLEFDEEEYRATNDRLNQINRLKDKYGNSIEKILEYADNARRKLEKFNDYEQYMENLKAKKKQCEADMDILCDKISAIRKKEACNLAKALEESLEGMNFLSVNFEVNFETCPDYTADGKDDVEFLISTNPGESVRPLVQVASGGELSRIMLAIKTILAGQDQGITLIFDEIDAGISGKTAWQVSEKLGQLGKEHQVFCITHLPQIAAMGDSHYVIEKGTEGSKTRTDIRLLDESESIEELARLLGGETITEAVRYNAVEMKETAKQSKINKK